MPTAQFIYEDDDELTHRLVYIGALKWPDDNHKGVKLVDGSTLETIAERYGLSRRKTENPEWRLLQNYYGSERPLDWAGI